MEKDESNTHRHLDGQVDFGGLDREIKKTVETDEENGSDDEDVGDWRGK